MQNAPPCSSVACFYRVSSFLVSLSVSSPPFPISHQISSFLCPSFICLYVPFSAVSTSILFLSQYIFILSLFPFFSCLCSFLVSLSRLLCLCPFLSCLSFFILSPFLLSLSYFSFCLYRFLLFLLSSFSLILFFS